MTDTPSSPRSGQFYFSRAIECAAARTLRWGDVGLLHRLWTDVRWQPVTKVIRGRHISFDRGEALVSVTRLADENGCSRNTVSSAIKRIADAGWIEIEELDEGYFVRCIVGPTDEDGPGRLLVNGTSRTIGGGAQKLRRGVLKNCAGGCAEVEQGGAQKLSTTDIRTQVNDPRLTISGPEAAVSAGALTPTPKCGAPDSRPLDPERDVHPALRAVAGRVGVSLGNVAELTMRSDDEPRVLSRLLQLADRAGAPPPKPDRWLRDKCRRGPSDDHHPEAKRLLGLTRTLPGLNFLEGQLPQAEPETAGDVLERSLRKEA